MKEQKQALKTINSTKKPKKIPLTRSQGTATSLSNSRPEALQRKPNLTLKYAENFATNGTSLGILRQYPGWNLICCSALFLKM